MNVSDRHLFGRPAIASQDSCLSNTSTAKDSPWPAQIASTSKIRDVKISLDGCHILYQVEAFYKANRTLSELWLAQTDVQRSARPVTNGLFNDRAGVFHPDGRRVVLLSDRHDPGKSLHVYMLQLNFEGGEYPEPVRVADFGKKGVQGFEISPNGYYIAFTRVDETASEDKHRKIERRDDAWVFGENSGSTKLHVYSFSTNTISTIEEIRKDRHIESFTWSPDSKRLLYCLRLGRTPEYAEQEVTLEAILVEEGSRVPVALGLYPRSPSGQNIWLPSGYIVSLQSYDPRNLLDARALFAHYVDGHFTSKEVKDCSQGHLGLGTAGDRYMQESWRRDVDDRPHGVAQGCRGSGGGSHTLYGQTEDAVRIVNMTSKNHDPQDGGMIAVEVCSDVDTHIDVVSFEGNTMKTLFTLFQTQEDAIWFGAWDATRTIDGNGNVSYICVAVLSSGLRHEPPNVWACRVSGEPQQRSTKIKLSSHLQWLAGTPIFKTEVMRWKAADGTELSGLARYPPGYDGRGRLPTVLFIHGGPYRRDIPDFMPYFCNWRELLALSGYLVISPNYRGSQGRGHQFARTASQGVGVYDWPDCESMVDEVIRRGLADPERLGIAGWSHGGSLTAWGVTKTKDRFKAAVVGAGVSDWEGMVMSASSPELEGAIGQSIPWDHDAQERSLRKMSPIHSVARVSTAVLILHGEKDERVPVGQAVGLWRGLKRKASERGKEAAQLVLYPREPHGFVERKHAEDVMKRVLLYFETWI